MRSINRVVLTGGVTRDPELRRTPSGKPVTTLRLGYTTQRRVNGAWRERSNYIDVEAWGALAESVTRHLSKGRQVAVDGRLEWREYEARDGGRRQVHVVVADGIEFLAGGGGGNGQGQAPARVAEATDDERAEDVVPF